MGDEIAMDSTEEKSRGGQQSDPYAKYLSEMATIPLMTHEQEVAAFRDLGRHESALVCHLLTSRPVRESLCGLDDAVREFEGVDRGAIASDPVGKGFDDLVRVIRLTDTGRMWLETSYEHPGYGMPEEWYSHLRRLRSAQARAKSKCVSANLRLVVKIANRYRVTNGMSPVDLVQEGNIGLMKAVDRFDVEKGFKFITYATWWIRATIKRAIIEKGMTIRLPVHLMDCISQVNKAENELMVRNGRIPDAAEVAAEAKIPVHKAEAAMAQRTKRTVTSLHAPVYDPSGSEMQLLDTIEDESVVPQDEALHATTVSGAIFSVLAALTPQESQILRWRFGFDDQDPLTLQEIGDKLSLSRERIRQIETRAIKKLQVRGGMQEYR